MYVHRPTIFVFCILVLFIALFRKSQYNTHHKANISNTSNLPWVLWESMKDLLLKDYFMQYLGILLYLMNRLDYG